MNFYKGICLTMLCLLVACTAATRPSTDGIDQAISKAEAGEFGKCLAHSEHFGDQLRDAKFHRGNIAEAATPQPNWYYNRTQKIADAAVEQGKLAENVCGQYVKTNM